MTWETEKIACNDPWMMYPVNPILFAAKRAPKIGATCPNPHPDYEYMVEKDFASDSIILGWRRK